MTTVLILKPTLFKAVLLLALQTTSRLTSIYNQFVVQNDLGVSFSIVGNEVDELCSRATLCHGSLANEQLLNIGHGQYLLQTLRNFVQNWLGRASWRQ